MTTQFNQHEIHRITEESKEGFRGYTYNDFVLLIDELIPQCRELLGERNLGNGFAVLEVICQAMSHSFSRVYKSFEISHLTSFQERLEQFNDLIQDMKPTFEFDEKLSSTVTEFEVHTNGRLELLASRIKEVELRGESPLIAPAIVNRRYGNAG